MFLNSFMFYNYLEIIGLFSYTSHTITIVCDVYEITVFGQLCGKLEDFPATLGECKHKTKTVFAYYLISAKK